MNGLAISLIPSMLFILSCSVMFAGWMIAGAIDGLRTEADDDE